MIMGLRRKRPEIIDEHAMPTEPVAPQKISPLPIPPSEPVPKHSSRRPLHTGDPQNAAAFPPQGQGAVVRALPPALSERLITSLWRNLVPPGIRVCGLLIQVLLGLRFVGKLVGLTNQIAWVNVVYIFSDVLLMPFHAILPPLNQPFFTRVEVYTLLAIVVYGLCARLLIGLIKIFVDALQA
jgi:hypothetical protein